MTTPLNAKADILADLWINYRDEEDFAEFVEYNDIGLPLAYVLAKNIVKFTPEAESIVKETFDALLIKLGISDADNSFEEFEDLLEAAD